MKLAGTIRRIDDLGRVVIPKEMRQVLNIREGDPLELFLDKDTINLKKYNAIDLFEDKLKAVVDMLNNESVSREIAKEDKACVVAMVNMILAKYKESEKHND